MFLGEYSVNLLGLYICRVEKNFWKAFYHILPLISKYVLMSSLRIKKSGKLRLLYLSSTQIDFILINTNVSLWIEASLRRWPSFPKNVAVKWRIGDNVILEINFLKFYLTN